MIHDLPVWTCQDDKQSTVWSVPHFTQSLYQCCHTGFNDLGTISAACKLSLLFSLRLLVISSDTVGVSIVKNNKIGQYLHIRQCQVMGLAVEATNTLPVHKNLENIISDSERVRHNYCTVPKLAKISIKQWNVCRVCMSAWLCMGVSSPVLCLWCCSWSSELLHMWWWFHTGYNHMTDRCYCWWGDSPYSPASLRCMAGWTDEYVACWW